MEILFLFALILLNGAFAMSEMSLVPFNSSSTQVTGSPAGGSLRDPRCA